jgi:hypothetical protein
MFGQVTAHGRIHDRAKFVVVDNRECIVVGRSSIVCRAALENRQASGA